MSAKIDPETFIGCFALLGIALLCAAIFTAFGAAWGLTVSGFVLIFMAVRILQVTSRKKP